KAKGAVASVPLIAKIHLSAQKGLFFARETFKWRPVLQMKTMAALLRTPNRRIAAIAVGVVALDQVTKQIVLRWVVDAKERVVIEGFFKFVLWGNTGAAWSMFTGNNELLALIAIVALVALFLSRRHFDAGSGLGQAAFGLICGGILGNLIDRVWAK